MKMSEYFTDTNIEMTFIRCKNEVLGKLLLITFCFFNNNCEFAFEEIFRTSTRFLHAIN